MKYLTVIVSGVLVACGGGEGPATAPAVINASSTVEPLFHAAPVRLDQSSSGIHTQSTGDDLRWLSSRQLTIDAMNAASASYNPDEPIEVTADVTASALITTYTPAQIRAAYSMPVLPKFGTVLTKSQAAEMGAGQTIYVVDALHDPNIIAELAAFNTRFELPACTTKVVTSYPLAAPSSNTCDFSVVYSTPAGGITAYAPQYNAGWATEIALDVQWAHATAPLARIVLIEAPDTSVDSMISAIKLATAMGPGIVSMSFGAPEGRWSQSLDSAFDTSSMIYFAATGDRGVEVQWPSVSSKVIAVGGTTLSFAGTSQRTESSWNGTGGGTSMYTSIPGYQTSLTGLSSTKRSVADVSFNADPNSGQYVAIITPSSKTTSWISVGGTSLATPQWAGIMAVTNAVRINSDKAPIYTGVHSTLYSLSTANYATSFYDVITGANGTCASCTSRKGYDIASGLGTPNVNQLVEVLTGSSIPGTVLLPIPETTTPAPVTVVSAGPVITVTNMDGIAGQPVTGSIIITDPGHSPSSLSISISNRPQGMSMTVKGMSFTTSWKNPVAGNYVITVIATELGGKSATANMMITIK